MCRTQRNPKAMTTPRNHLSLSVSFSFIVTISISKKTTVTVSFTVTPAVNSREWMRGSWCHLMRLLIKNTNVVLDHIYECNWSLKLRMQYSDGVIYWNGRIMTHCNWAESTFSILRLQNASWFHAIRHIPAEPEVPRSGSHPEILRNDGGRHSFYTPHSFDFSAISSISRGIPGFQSVSWVQTTRFGRRRTHCVHLGVTD